MINLMSAATATPQHQLKTTELIASLMHKLSPELINTICSLGVDQRYSVMDNYPDFLEGQPMNAASSTTGLGIDATRRCLEEWGGDPARVGLLVAATNTPDQMLPCLASEVMGQTHGLLSRSLRTVSMQSQGCSVLLKSVEVAQWYLAANPNKLAIVLMAEAHTPYVAPLLRDEYHGFRELIRLRKEERLDEAEFEQQRLDTTFVIQSMLFGDGAVALLIGKEEGKPAFGPIAHLTNDEPEDMNLLRMTANSSHPLLKGRPQYFMKPSVPPRCSLCSDYSEERLERSRIHRFQSEHKDCMIHTGSKKILDGVCSQLALNKDSEKVLGSYEVLKNYGNLSSASTGFMLAEKQEWTGPAIIAGFGVGFAASAGVMRLN
jgi:3-oxoacyl-[acyl-carrier-protein] synthase-3